MFGHSLDGCRVAPCRPPPHLGPDSLDACFLFFLSFFPSFFISFFLSFFRLDPTPLSWRLRVFSGGFRRRFAWLKVATIARIVDRIQSNISSYGRLFLGRSSFHSPRPHPWLRSCCCRDALKLESVRTVGDWVRHRSRRGYRPPPSSLSRPSSELQRCSAPTAFSAVLRVWCSIVTCIPMILQECRWR